MRKDKQLIVLTHLAQLSTLIIGFGSLIVPLVLWVINKDKVCKMDQHGKQIINFQLSLLVYCLICIPLILFFGLGVVGFIALGISAIVYPILNAIRVNNGEAPKYPLSLNFIS